LERNGFPKNLAHLYLTEGRPKIELDRRRSGRKDPWRKKKQNCLTFIKCKVTRAIDSPHTPAGAQGNRSPSGQCRIIANTKRRAPRLRSKKYIKGRHLKPRKNTVAGKEIKSCSTGKRDGYGHLTGGHLKTSQPLSRCCAVAGKWDDQLPTSKKDQVTRKCSPRRTFPPSNDVDPFPEKIADQ